MNFALIMSEQTATSWQTSASRSEDSNVRSRERNSILSILMPLRTASGWGRELGLQGLEAYLEHKSVHHHYDAGGLDWPIVL